MLSRTVCIAGGGASGTLLAAALTCEMSAVRAIVVEPRERLGAGLAYSTSCPQHVLNVPAARMSAHAADADHFVRWLAREGYDGYDAQAFVPRSIYGAYLQAVAEEAGIASGGRVEHVRARAVAARAGGNGVEVELDDGATIRAEALVVAVGNAAPARWGGVPARDSGRFFASAWEPGAYEVGDPDERVLLLGTGLTAVDAVLGLRYNGHRGPISMISRRGLLPHEHRLLDAPPERGSGWRDAADEMRGETNALWQSMELHEQRRFLRHLMPYWSVHRHRMAPEVAKRIADAVAGGSLRMLAGRTLEIEATPHGLRVPLIVRGTGERLVLEVGRVVNCSGPEHDVRKLPNPLVANMLDGATMRPHPLGVGVDVAPDGALRDGAGIPSDRFYAIGPVRFGTLIETTAIPEIRAQAAELAKTLARRLAGIAGMAEAGTGGRGMVSVHRARQLHG